MKKVNTFKYPIPALRYIHLFVENRNKDDTSWSRQCTFPEKHKKNYLKVASRCILRICVTARALNDSFDAQIVHLRNKGEKKTEVADASARAHTHAHTHKDTGVWHPGRELQAGPFKWRRSLNKSKPGLSVLWLETSRATRGNITDCSKTHFHVHTLCGTLDSYQILVRISCVTKSEEVTRLFCHFDKFLGAKLATGRSYCDTWSSVVLKVWLLPLYRVSGWVSVLHTEVTIKDVRYGFLANIPDAFQKFNCLYKNKSIKK